LEIATGFGKKNLCQFNHKIIFSHSQIIHLKRFNYVNTKWVKSQKVVNFPFDNFDPTLFLASVPQENILRHKELMEMKAKNLKNRDCSDEITEFDLENDIPLAESERKCDVIQEESSEGVNGATTSTEAYSSVKPEKRKRLVSTSLTKTPVIDTELIDYNNHMLKSSADPFDLKYKLYAVVVS
jgi:ubiquitin carboxyl-terminal hydrolase 6/32